jgi:YfiH family protein
MNKVSIHEKCIIAYTTVADGNMDDRFSDRSVTMANRRKILNQFNLNPKLVVEGKQIHSDRILILDEENTKMWFGCNIPGVDGFITDQTDVGMLLKVADCVPVVVYDPENHRIGVFHAGWQGAVKNIHTKGIAMMHDRYETNPEKVLVWLGPSAHKCCFTSDQQPEQIDQAAWEKFITKNDTEWNVDLVGYIVETLKQQGVNEKNITIDSQCTVETADLFSHVRSKKTDEAEGRFLVLAKLG